MKYEIVRWFSAMLATLAIGASWGADPLVVYPGSPKVMTPADCAVSYAQAYVLDDLTLDGVDIAVTNANNVQIGGSYSGRLAARRRSRNRFALPDEVTHKGRMR